MIFDLFVYGWLVAFLVSVGDRVASWTTCVVTILLASDNATSIDH